MKLSVILVACLLALLPGLIVFLAITFVPPIILVIFVALIFFCVIAKMPCPSFWDFLP